MKNNKLICLLLTVLVCFSLVMSVSAASDKLVLTAEANASAAKAGDTITVSVMIDENPGFYGSLFYVEWDESALEFNSVNTTASAFTDVVVRDVAGVNNQKGIEVGNAMAAYFNPNATKYTNTGKVVELNFKVKTVASDAATLVNIIECSYMNLDKVSYNDLNKDKLVINSTSVNLVSANHVHTPGAEATCTTNQICTWCSEELVPVLGHLKDVVIPAVPATCEVTGLTQGASCSRCGKITVEQQTVGALGHLKDVKIPAKAPTCIATGLTEGASCSRCGTITVEQQTVPMVEHTMPEKWTQTKAPTCLDKGEEQRVCTTEGCTKTETREIKALGHDWNKVAAEAPTCSKEGKKELWTCKVCKAVDTENNGAPIAKLAHTPGVLAAKAPTCTDTGLTEGSYCLVCTEVITAQKVLAVVPHNMSESFVNDNADKHWKECEDCGFKTEEGAHTLEKGVCTVCGYGCKHKGGTATCSKKAVCEICGMQYGNKKAHTPGAAATCETDQICTVCNAVVKKATGHKYVDHEAKDPTCTEKGNKAYQTCENCDFTTFEEIAAAGHKLVNHEAKAATCAEIGWDAYETCENCDHTTYKEIAATGNHTYDNDCDADCNVCTEKRTPADHKYGEWETVKEATTKEEGEKKHTCTVCGNSESEKIPMVEPEGLPTWLILVIALGVVAVVVIIIIVAKKKKK